MHRGIDAFDPKQTSQGSDAAMRSFSRCERMPPSAGVFRAFAAMSPGSDLIRSLAEFLRQEDFEHALHCFFKCADRKP